jgi:hypothetical protein
MSDRLQWSLDAMPRVDVVSGDRVYPANIPQGGCPADGKTLGEYQRGVQRDRLSG